MDEYQEGILKVALLGTERQNQVPIVPPALQSLVAQLYPEQQVPKTEQREHTFLGTLALMHQYYLVGQVPEKLTQPLETKPLSTNDLPVISAASASHLKALLTNTDLRPLLAEWLEKVAAQKLSITPTLLTDLINFAHQTKIYVDLIRPILGKHGVWLIEQHSEWNKLFNVNLVDKEDIWEEGNLYERTQYLTQLHNVNPVKALELLQQVWNKEAVANRQTLLKALSTNISSIDEPFLNQVLANDRGTAVRVLAAELLSCIPNSAFVQRHIARLNQWITFTKPKGVLKKLKNVTLTVQLPTAFDKAWEADGIAEYPPRGKGQQTFWFEQSLGFVPPSYWSEQWQLTPEQLLKLTAKHDWGTELRTGWLKALHINPDVEWISAWFRGVSDVPNTLWTLLPTLQATELALELCKNSKNVWDIFYQLRFHWSPSFSKQLLPFLVNAIYHSKHLNYAHGILSQVAVNIHTSVEPLLSHELAKVLNDEYHPLHPSIKTFIETIRFRADILAALENPTTH